MSDAGSPPDADGDAGRDSGRDAGQYPGGDDGRDSAGDPEPLVRGVRWLGTVPVSISLCVLLGWVYVAELLVLLVADPGTATWWFVATTSSPGWVLGPLAHTPADPTHLLGNVVLLVVFGGMTERRLGRWPYLGVLAVSAVGGTAGQLASYALASEPGGTLGASAMALAATAFATVAAVRTRVTTGRWDGETTWVWALLGTAVVGRRLVLDLAVGVPAVGRFGHLWGILFGVGLALARPTRHHPGTSEE